MKKALLSLLFCGLVAFAGSASAITITQTGASLGKDVGEVDSFLASTNLSNSSGADELEWVLGVLKAKNFTTEGITLTAQINTWLTTDKEGVYALALKGDPLFFMIKTGNLSAGNGAKKPPVQDSNDHFLYENLPGYDWAVLDLGAEIEILNIGKVSHIGAGGEAPVPEPSTMMLFGAGLLGVSIYGKRRRNS